MRKLEVYVDTSVFGGTNDDEFREESMRFFDLARQGRYLLLVSRITVDELEGAPSAVRDFVRGLPPNCLQQVPVTEEVEVLAQDYLDAGALGEKSRADALHVAAATVARADLILSWNFKHIVNYDRIRRFNGINVLKGYNQIEIRSPLEIGYGDEDQEV